MVRGRDGSALRLLGQQPALDGLRALAVGVVMGFHAEISQFKGGYLGVDVFFVLSGFLITSILASEHASSGRVDFGAFYMRRALRLLPAVLALVGIVSVAAAVGPHLIESDTIGRDAPATIFYSANWVYALLGHFEIRLLSHTWSLSIEEQFYLVWPLILVATLLLARGRRWLTVAIPFGLFIASNALRWWLYRRGHTSLPRLTYGTDTRAGAMMLGCAAGMLYTRDLLPRGASGRMAMRVVGVGGVVGLLWMLFGDRYSLVSITEDPGRIHGDGYTLIAVFSAFVILWLVSEPASALARFFGLQPIAWIGRVSYGLYLWHLPIDRFVTAPRLGVSTEATQLVRLAVTFAIVAASFYLLEQPFLRLKRRFERRPDSPTVTALAPS